jgi:hypothetical protein
MKKLSRAVVAATAVVQLQTRAPGGIFTLEVLDVNSTLDIF